MSKTNKPTPAEPTVPATAPTPVEPIAAPPADAQPVTEGGEKTANPAPDAPVMDPISTRQSDFEIVYADWAGTTADQVAGLRLMNGSYNNPKVAHCWHFYQLGSGGLE